MKKLLIVIAFSCSIAQAQQTQPSIEQVDEALQITKLQRNETFAHDADRIVLLVMEINKLQKQLAESIKKECKPADKKD